MCVMEGGVSKWRLCLTAEVEAWEAKKKKLEANKERM